MAFTVFLLAYTPLRGRAAGARGLFGWRPTASRSGAQLAGAWVLAVLVFQVGFPGCERVGRGAGRTLAPEVEPPLRSRRVWGCRRLWFRRCWTMRSGWEWSRWQQWLRFEVPDRSGPSRPCELPLGLA